MRGVVPTAAALTCGLALYFTDSVLDQVVLDGRPLRVALVPGWPVLVAFLGMAALAMLWLARRTRPRTVTGVPIRLRIDTLVLPVFALLLLVVPYLPFLPDRIPALQILAGPLKWVVWLTVGGLIAWTVAQARVIKADALARATVPQATLAIGVLTALTAGAAASRLAGTVIFPAGDEPHYLVIAQSVWRDHDLKIENNHVRGDYREYFDRDLKPDYLTRGGDGEIYSIHPVGMPVLMAPVYGIGGYWAVVAALILFAATAAAVMWRSIVELTNAPGAATFAWAAVAATSPYLYNTFTVYPEIVAALAVVLAFTRATDPEPQRQTIWRALLVGVSCASLPWLSTKYAPMSAALVTIAIARILFPVAPAPATVPACRDSSSAATRIVAVAAPYVVSLAAWFSFFYVYWGTPLPAAPYGDLVQTSVRNLVFGAPGLLFDQEYGVLAYAPVYILAVTGLVVMWQAGGEVRRRALETTIVVAALLVTVGAFRIWWGGTASPGRPVASGLLLLAFPVAIAVRAAPPGSARRAAQQLLLWVSIGVAATLMVAQQGLLINNGRDGTATLLEYWSPSWNVWALVPTFIFHEATTAWMHSIAWLLVAGIAAVVLGRWRTRSAAGASLAAVATFSAALLILVFVMPWLPHDPPLPPANLDARSRLELLDSFDATSRPIAIRYDPFHLASSSSTVPLASLRVLPGTRPDPQPIRVLHNGRFSLPAGRYQADFEWAQALPRSAPISLQIGRIEPPWQTWQVQPQPGSHWAVDFDLPVNGSFVGFRGGTDVERAVGRVTITPLSIIDESARPHVPSVLATRQYGRATAMFHDEESSPEPTGFWVLGGHTARVTIVRDKADAPLVLRVHSGREPNRVTIGMRGWHETLTLDAAAPQTITLPDSNRQLLTIDVFPEDGFSPRTYDPQSQDPRYLGAWVEVVN